jgi:trimeric autotransporter adhesin
MKRFWTALAVAAATLFAAAGCNDYGNTFQVPTGATLTSLSPASVSAGTATFTLTLNGAGFLPKTVVQWNGKTIPTTLTTDSSNNVTGVTATVDSSLVAKQGTAFVNTLSPHSGAGTNGLSNVLAFIINPPPNPVPVVSGISPSCALAGGASFTLTVNGSSFLPTSDPSGGSQVRWTAGSAQSTLAIVSIGSASQIQATVPASLIAAAGSASVTVSNPPSPQTAPPGQVGNPPSGGGGSSINSPTFTIVQPPATCPPGTTATAATQARIAEETPAVSADGRYVAYSAQQGGHTQVFLRDTCEAVGSGCEPRTLLLSAASDGTPGSDDSRSPSMSADGRYVAFSSAATNLVADAPAGRQVFIRDTCFGAKESCTPLTELVSKDESGALVGTESILPSVSGSGRFVAFVAVTPSHTSNKAAAQNKGAAAGAGATNSGFRQVFVRDTCFGAANCTPKTTRISLQPGDTSSTDANPAGPAVSGTGQHVAVPEAQTATLFTHGVAVDDRVFLARTSKQ